MTTRGRDDSAGCDASRRLQCDCVDSKGVADFNFALRHPVFLADVRARAAVDGLDPNELLAEVGSRLAVRQSHESGYDSTKAMLRTWLNRQLSYAARDLRRRQGRERKRKQVPIEAESLPMQEEVLPLVPKLEVAIRAITDPNLHLMARVKIAPQFDLGEPLTLKEAAALAGWNTEAFRQRYVEELRQLIIRAME